MECKRESDYTGLTAAEAEHRLTKYGRNTLEQHKKKSPVLLFLGQFKDIMTIILIVCTGISAWTVALDRTERDSMGRMLKDWTAKLAGRRK